MPATHTKIAHLQMPAKSRKLEKKEEKTKKIEIPNDKWWGMTSKRSEKMDEWKKEKRMKG